MTDGAGEGEHLFAFHGVAGFFDLRGELGEEFVLGFRVGIELVDHRVRLLGDLLVGVGAEAGDVAGADVFGVELAVLDGGEESEGGFGAFADGVEGLGAEGGIEVVEDWNQLGHGGGFTQ